MTIQFPQLEQTEPRLSTDSTNLRDHDSSFAEKLQREQARLGLLFSPFAQLGSLFAPALNLGFKPEDFAQAITSGQTAENYRAASREPSAAAQQAASGNETISVPLFESLPPVSFNRQQLQELLAATNWLVPNLQAQPSFFQASQNGALRANFDLQALIDQLVKQVNMVKSKGKVEFSLTLEPAELGRLVLTLTSHAGLISVDIQALSGTKKALDLRRGELERALAKAHVHFDEIKIREVENHA